MAKTIELVVIDPQNDFCDPSGALSVTGADQDMKRLAAMVRRIYPKLNDIHVTLDSHHNVHIAHPIFWRDSAGNHPNPFTIINSSDMKNGKWDTTNPSCHDRAVEYLAALEQRKRYLLCVWNPHCLIGSPGSSVNSGLFSALSLWTDRFATIDWVTKGSNIFTEHYSAVEAEVPDPADPTTQVNACFIETILKADIIAISGEASSHCTKNTLQDIWNYPGTEKYINKFVILTDAMSPVPGFESLQDDFFKEAKDRGAQFSTTVDFLT